MAPFFMDGVQLPQGQSHFEDAVYFLPFSSQKFLVPSPCHIHSSRERPPSCYGTPLVQLIPFQLSRRIFTINFEHRKSVSSVAYLLFGLNLNTNSTFFFMANYKYKRAIRGECLLLSFLLFTIIVMIFINYLQQRR